MLDIGWQELFIVGVIALIVVGPKELPRALRTVTGLVRKGRSMAREFQHGIDDMVREAELDELREQVKDATGTDLKGDLERSIDPNGDVRRAVDPREWEEDVNPPPIEPVRFPDDESKAPAAGEGEAAAGGGDTGGGDTGGGGTGGETEPGAEAGDGADERPSGVRGTGSAGG